MSVLKRIALPLWQDSTFAIDNAPTAMLDAVAATLPPIKDMGHVLEVARITVDSAQRDLITGLFEIARLKLAAVYTMFRLRRIEDKMLTAIVDQLRAIEFVQVFASGHALGDVSEFVQREFAKGHNFPNTLSALAMRPESVTLETVKEAMVHIPFAAMMTWNEDRH